MSMLTFKNFSKSYGSSCVLGINDFIIGPGLFWIKGANGSGKSTLLKSIAGIIDFDGDIVLESNVSLKKNPIPYRRQINFAEAEPVFPEFLTGMELIKLFANAKGGTSRQYLDYIEGMHMTEYMEDPLRTYSSGMLKKLSVVLAFLGSPKIILLDEPLITMDAESLQILYSWIITMYEEQQVTFLMSSHQPLDLSLDLHGLLVERQTLQSIA